jgi:hypothetical protein
MERARRQKPPPRGAPGQERSKASQDARRDARTGHDKDGNLQQLETARAARRPKKTR